MFEIGSYVMYRAEGVCRISDIRDEKFGAIGGQEKYYILSPLNDEKSVVYVPMGNDVLLGMMRPLMSAEEICRLASELKDERWEWIPENRARNAAMRELIARGDRRELIVLVNTILERREASENGGKRLTGSDENLLRRAVKLLFEEFLITTDIGGEEDILPLLRGELVLHSR